MTSKYNPLVHRFANFIVAWTVLLFVAGALVTSNDAALSVPGVKLHLYEKHKPRKGRKMGHLSAVGATVDEAVKLVLEAKSRL